MLKKWMYLGLILAMLTVTQHGLWGVAQVYADPPPRPSPPQPPSPDPPRPPK
jgi:hypothetical protein